MGFPHDSVIKNPTCNAGVTGDTGSSPGAEHGNPLQCSCLETPCTEEPGELQSTGSQRVRQRKQLSTKARVVGNTMENLGNGQQPLEGSQALVLTSSLGCARGRKSLPDIRPRPMQPQRAVVFSPYIALSILLDAATQEPGIAYCSPSLAFINAGTSSSQSSRVITNVIESISVFWFQLCQQRPV